jgi:predicted DNA-binding mobile mystery protein A
MELNFKRLMRQQIQDKIDKINVPGVDKIQKEGWIRTIRKALGMSINDLAHRLDCKSSNITLLEKNEVTSKIKLETLEKVAEAMNCRLVYAFIPQDNSLEEIIKTQARLVAKRIVQKNNHSMKLEDQGISKEQMKQQEDDVYKKILDDASIKLWALKDEL